MYRALNKETNQVVAVPEDQLQELLQTGDYVLEDQDLPFVGPSGDPVGIQSTEAQEAIKQGYTPESHSEASKRERREKYANRPFEAGAAGLARSVTLGLSDQALTKTGVVEPETLRGLEAENPTATLAGEALGYLVPGAVAEKAGVALGKGILGAAVEGGIQGLGKLASDEALNKADINAENILAYAGLGSVLNAGGKTAFDLTGKVARSLGGALAGEGRALFSKLAEKKLASSSRTKASAIVEEDMSPAMNEYLEGLAKQNVVAPDDFEGLTLARLKEMKIAENFGGRQEPLIKGKVKPGKIAEKGVELAEEETLEEIVEQQRSGFGFLGGMVAEKAIGGLGGGKALGLGYAALKAYRNPQVVAKGLEIIENVLKKNDDKISKAVNGFLSEGTEATERGVVPTLSVEFISRRQQDESEEEALERIRNDLNSFTGNPESLINTINDNVPGVHDTDPETMVRLSSVGQRAVAYLNGEIPKVSGPKVLRFGKQKPPSSEIKKFARKVEVVINPFSILDKLKRGTIKEGEIHALRNVYPQLFNQIKTKIMEEIISQKRSLPFGKRQQIQKLFGVPGMAYAPSFILGIQEIFKNNQEEGKAPNYRGTPNFSKDWQTNIERITNK